MLGAFPWNEPGTLLERYDGPEPWQRDILIAIRDGLLDPSTAIQIAVASGHGIGKSALVAWIILWAFTTAPDTLGVVTANTEPQLKTKTWARLGEWFNLMAKAIPYTGELFKLTATALLSRDPTRERTWRVDMIPWSETNPEAFAGLHNRGKRVLLIMDEGSGIADVIYETAEGALTDADTEIIWCVFGNPTRNTGRFREFFPGGRFASMWKTRNIDSRTVSITNKKQIAKWLSTYGEDSDWFKVRVRGVFPDQGLMEFFSATDVDAAMSPEREVYVNIREPLALGVDVARFGANNSVIFPRKGRDARSIARRVYNGINTVELATRVYETQQELHADGIMIDGGGVGGGVVDNCRRMHLFVYEVQFGGKDDVGGSVWGIDGERYANKRSAMYGALRFWLRTGAIPCDPILKAAFMAITYTFNKKDEIQLVSKEDILEDNPEVILDDLDALALTFAYPLSAHDRAGGEHPQRPLIETEYDPFERSRMEAA